MRRCSVEEIEGGSTSSQTGTSRIPGPWLERRHTEGRHTRLHEGSISVGSSFDGGGGPGRARRALCRNEGAGGAADCDGSRWVVNNSVVIYRGGW